MWGIITARKGSTRLLNKNIKKLGEIIDVPFNLKTE